jgi:hypothetical protein
MRIGWKERRGAVAKPLERLDLKPRPFDRGAGAALLGFLCAGRVGAPVLGGDHVRSVAAVRSPSMNCPGVRSNALASLKMVLIWTSRCPFSIRDISVGCTPLRSLTSSWVVRSACVLGGGFSRPGRQRPRRGSSCEMTQHPIGLLTSSAHKIVSRGPEERCLDSPLKTRSSEVWREPRLVGSGPARTPLLAVARARSRDPDVLHA